MSTNHDEEPLGGDSSGHAEEDRRGGQRAATWRGVDDGAVMSAELMGGIAVYGGLGYALDRWLGTAPWLFMVGALFGFGIGLWLVWLRSGRLMRAAQAAQDAGRDGRPASDGARDDRERP